MTAPLPTPDFSILLVKTSSMGDVVHLMPAITDIAGAFPHAKIDWVVEETFTDLPKLHPALNRVIPVAQRRWRRAPWSAATWNELGEFRAVLRQRTYDIVIDAQGLLKSAMLAALARGEHAGQGFDYAREPLATLFYSRRLAVPWTLPAITANRQLVAAALSIADKSSSCPDYGIGIAPLAADWLPATPYAVLLHGASAVRKLWPEPDWITLGSCLSELDLRCVLPWGNAAEHSRAERLAQQIPHAILAPELSLAQAAGLLAGARLAVGVDSGLTHLAAALGTPVIALFGGSDPERTGVVAMDKRYARNLGREGERPTSAQAIATAREVLM